MSDPRTPAIAFASGVRAAVAACGVLWRFSRPHTIAGTTVSVVGLYAIAAELGHAPGFLDLAATLIAACAVNVAIVGLNQIEDVEIDRVNKPELPLAAGELRADEARTIVAGAAALPVAMALTQGAIELAAVVVALALGVAYSSPPLRLKRFPALAALSISLVRSLVVNLGVYGHFAGSLTQVPGVVWALVLFVMPFSIAIALLKDIPDIDGDARFQIRTFSVRLGPSRVLAIALTALAAAYLGMAAAVVALAEVNGVIWLLGHAAAVALLTVWARDANPRDKDRFGRFYLRVWQLFFFEYVLVAASVVL